ncbi:MAG: TolC family outer membrane protein [Gammaproteobacteria bacterium]|nr:TolC family outer membrane protein [Gammaproteobacteria bacterium]
MKRNALVAALALVTLAITPASQATSLLDAFQTAITSDPVYKQADDQYQSDETQIAQARAGVLPTIGLTSSYNRQQTFTGYNNANFPGATASSTTTYGVSTYDLSISQPIFDWQAFKQIAQAKAAVQQSAATYAYAGQDLIIRLAQAYFNVLQAQDVLRYSESQKKALYRQYEVSKERYHVGLDPITSLYKSQAAYDSARAEYLADQNNLADMREQLRQITGVYYTQLKTLEDNFPLVAPVPMNIEQWVKTAVEQNLQLRAARFGVLAAEENVGVQSSGNLPTLDATGSFQSTRTQNQIPGYAGAETTREGQLGVALNFPMYSGGIDGAKAAQAKAQYQLAIAQMEQQYRATVANTRTSYLSVVSQISQVEADRQSIKSSAAALESISAGYQAGTQTILDVLEAQKDLFSAEKDYAQDRFAYLINTLKLKEAAGVLSPNDLSGINQWLTADKVPAPNAADMTASAPKVKPTAKPAVTAKSKAQATTTAAKKPATATTKTTTVAPTTP